MSVYLADDDRPGGDLGESHHREGRYEETLRHSGIAPAGTHREHEVTDSEGSQPPPSYSRAADDHAQLALVESTHAEANLGLLVRGLQHLLAGAGAARDAHAALSRELAALRELLAQGTAAEQAALARVQVAENDLASVRKNAALERARFIDEEDRFLAELLADHHREVAELRARLDVAVERAESLRAEVVRVESERAERARPELEVAPVESPRAEVPHSGTQARPDAAQLASAATQPSLQAANWPSRAPEFPVAEWATPEPAFTLTDWAPQPPFSLREFAEERTSSEFEDSERRKSHEVPAVFEPKAEDVLPPLPPVAKSEPPATTSEDGAPDDEVVVDGDTEAGGTTDTSALVNETAGRALDPEETPLPTWQAISTLASLQVPTALEEPAEPAPPVDAPARAPSSSQTGAVIAVIKPKSVRMSRRTPEPSPLAASALLSDTPPEAFTDDEPEPTTVRGTTPDPGAVAERVAAAVEESAAPPEASSAPLEADERAPHLVDTVRPPPLIRPKPDFSQRPLREYSLGSSDVAEERFDAPPSEPPPHE